MILPIAGIATTLNLLFFLFFFGEILHTDLLELSERIYQSEWYRYPVCTQRFVLIMIMRAQHSFHVSAYGIVRCNLENFVGVSEKLCGNFLKLFSCNYFYLHFRCWDQYRRLSWCCEALGNSEKSIRFHLRYTQKILYDKVGNSKTSERKQRLLLFFEIAAWNPIFFAHILTSNE